MKAEITTSLGSVVLELNQNKAPKTVENFLEYVKSGFYDGPFSTESLRAL